MNTVISAINFHRASPIDRERGLLGWASFELDGLRIDGAQIRRTAAGRTAFFWPEHVGRTGWRYAVVWPQDDEQRVAIEGAGLDDLKQRGFVA